MTAKFEPTDEERQYVESLSGFGVPQEDISLVVRDGIDAKTLRKYFAKELRVGKVKANAKVGQSLYQQAVKGNMTAAIFWAKTQMGWREGGGQLVLPPDSVAEFIKQVSGKTSNIMDYAKKDEKKAGRGGKTVH